MRLLYNVPERDPKAWRFLGSQDGVKWTLLDEQKDVPVWPERMKPKTFSFANPTAYAHYRFEFLATHNAPHFQIAEIALGPEVAAAGFKNYLRELDLNTAVHRVTYEKNGVRFTREAFASFPANVIVLHFTADKPGALSCEIALSDAHGARTAATAAGLSIAGDFPAYKYEGGKTWPALNREAQLRVLHSGGTVSPQDDKIRVERADNLTLLLAAGTDFQQDRAKNWRGPLPHAAINARLDAAAAASYADLLAAHVKDYRRLFDRVRLDLGNHADPKLPTNVRFKQYQNDQPDTGLEELLFQYGRYLLISASREGGLPANLQGRWNDSNSPPWRCDYHTDINVQMNYWMADAANLGECFQPYAAWIESIRAVRTEATKKEFGIRGWAMRGEAGLFGGSTWDWIPGTSAWLLQNSFDHYAFTRDKEYLRTRAYPAMKEVCEFWIDHLKALPDGTLVAPNGFSPEHGPKEDGVSFDQQLVWDLFTNTLEASEALGVDKSFHDTLAAKRAKLLGPKIGKWKQLQEWMTDRDDPKDNHRHMSHLIAVHPGGQITPFATPALAEAAKVSLAARGDDSTGWSTAWKINLWARLRDGDHAHKVFRYLIRPCESAGVVYEAGGMYQNLFDAHPPFQIDGNFGYVSGVCEMLLQSHAGEIDLLPALPKAWPNGQVRGLRARGGFEVDESWENGALTKAIIHSLSGEAGIVRLGAKTLKLNLKAGESAMLDGMLTAR